MDIPIFIPKYIVLCRCYFNTTGMSHIHVRTYYNIIILLFKEMVNINTQKQQKAWKETKIILDNKTKTKTKTKYASKIATSKWEINDQNGSLM